MKNEIKNMTFCIVMFLLHIVAQWKVSLSVFDQRREAFVWKQHQRQWNSELFIIFN